MRAAFSALATVASGLLYLAYAQDLTDSSSLGSYFHPPPAYRNDFGQFRSPLIFKDGSRVSSASDWTRRRDEIRREWERFMGPWPPVLTEPKVDYLSEVRMAGYVRHRVWVQIAADQSGEGWMLIPEGAGPFPALLVVYYEPETSVGLSKDPLRDFGSQLARRGFVTLSIGTPGGNAWKPEIGQAQCQPLSFHAYVAANCWTVLANTPRVDASRIGLVGHSYGGKWAMFAAAFWEKFAAVAVSDPGIVFDESRSNVNYWEPWYLGFDPHTNRAAGVPTATNPATGAYRELREAGHDLHEVHALIAPRPFLVSGGSEDPPSRWKALNHLVEVDRVLGFTNRVVMTSRQDHPPTEESNSIIYSFFEHFLKVPPTQD